MKRSEINSLLRSAAACFQAHGWTLPPNAHWDITDFGGGQYDKLGLFIFTIRNGNQASSAAFKALKPAKMIFAAAV
jgi:hypothetical protein